MKRKSKPKTVYLEDMEISKLEKIAEKRKKNGQSSTVSALIKELIVSGLNKGILNENN